MFGAIFSLSLLLALAAGAVMGWTISSAIPGKSGESQEEQKPEIRDTPLNDGEDFVD